MFPLCHLYFVQNFQVPSRHSQYFYTTVSKHIFARFFKFTMQIMRSSSSSLPPTFHPIQSVTILPSNELNYAVHSLTMLFIYSATLTVTDCTVYTQMSGISDNRKYVLLLRKNF